MKAFVSAIAALAATASADAQFYGLGLPYGGYGLGPALPAPVPYSTALELKCKDPIWGFPVLCAKEEAAAPAEAAPAEEEAAKEKRSADAQLYGYGGLGYGYGGLGYGYGAYGLGAPLIAAPLELKCKDPWGLPALCPPEPAAEEAKEKRSADAQLYGYGGLGYGYGGYGLPAPLIAPIALNCKNAWGFPVPCAQETPAEEEAAKEKRSADAQLYGYGGLGYGYGGYGLGYGLPAPLLAPVELNCKNAWGFPVLCAEETPAEEEAAKEKRSADPQLYLGPWGPWGGPLVHSSLLGICTNVDGEQVDC